MFRPMGRFKQQISEEECIRILSSEATAYTMPDTRRKASGH